MSRSFFATLTAYGVGLLILAVGTSSLVLLMGDQLAYSTRRADFLGAFGLVLSIAGLVGGCFAILFWLVLAWPFHVTLLRVAWIRRYLKLIGASAGGMLGIALSFIIGFWGGPHYAVLLILSGAAAGFTFSCMLQTIE